LNSSLFDAWYDCHANCGYMETEDLFNMTRTEYYECEMGTCGDIWHECVINDTICATHHAEYDECRITSELEACVQC